MTYKITYYISFLSNHRLLPESQTVHDMSSIIKAESEKKEKHNDFLKALRNVIKGSKDNR